MTDGATDIQPKRFRTRWMGLDTKEVELFCQQLNEENQRLKAENCGLHKNLQEQEKELLEYKEREKAIRTVLLNANKAVEQLKANAEKEAKLIVAEAELKAEKMLQGVHQRLAQLHNDIAELKRHRIQLETKLRSTIETYQRLLDMDKDDEQEHEPVSVSKVQLLNR
jgi:cell division initiation protein